MLAELSPFVERYPFVGKVDGRGLFLGIELVRDKRTKEPLSRRVTRAIFDECVRRGLLTMAYAPSFRIQPALTIDPATARNGIAILREVLDHVTRTGIWEHA
jgi:4-aminobutyrate aminotransferase-like enzyme